MKERTISQRNLLGAFIGGMLGILTFGYFDNLVLMVVACFAGVIGGWWYEELWRCTSAGFNEGMDQAKRLGAFLFTPIRRLKDWRKGLSELEFDGYDPVFHALAWLVTPFIWLLRRPVVIYQWARSHPVKRAYLIRIAMLPTFYAVNAAIIGLAALWLVQTARAMGIVDADRDPAAFPFWLAGIFLFCAGIQCLVVPLALLDNGEEDKRRDFYETWIRYDAIGPVRFYFVELGRLLRMWFSGLAFELAALLWFCGVGGLVLAIITVVSAVIGLLKGMYQVSLRGGHWLCFGVTLTMTCVAAWIGSDHFGDVRILWATALVTGVLSAVVTEGLRRFVVLAFRANRSVRAVAVIPLGRQLRPGRNLFWQVTKRVGDWFSNLLPLHPQLT